MRIDDDLKDALLNLRIASDDRERIDALAVKLPLSHPDITRAALRIGLSAIERDASVLLGPDAMTRGARRAPKPKPKRRKGKR
jgi:hypothetical protein